MKKFLAGLLAFIILVLFPIVLISTITIYWVFTPSTIKKVIHASEIGENLPSLIVALTAQQNSETATAAQFVSTTFSAQDVYSLIDPLVDGIGVWFGTNKPIEQLNLTINISNLKTKLAPAITEKLNQSDIKLPCTAGVPTASETFNIGCPTDTTSFSDEIMKNIPDTINVQDTLQQQLVTKGNGEQLTMINQQINTFRTYWAWLHWIVWLGWIVMAVSFLLIILLRLHPGYAPFGWLAWMSILEMLELIPLTLIVWLAPQFILPWLSGSFDNAIVTVINKAVAALFNVYLWPLLIVAAGLFIGSIFWFIVRFIVKQSISRSTQN